MALVSRGVAPALLAAAFLASGCGLQGAAPAADTGGLGTVAEPALAGTALASEASPSESSGRANPYLRWAQQLGRPTGIPPRALAAYAAADVALQKEHPSCRLNWATLAGIGWVESSHGTLDGARLDDAGVAEPSIVGPTLDGRAFGRVDDTDDGRLDGDRSFDHAVGPLQFTPGSWKRWASDGDGDGRKNPQDIDDAALAAGRYLCASGVDLTSSEGWWQAVKSYNHSDEYARDVSVATTTYATRSR
ncbi:MAG TPA: lytic murein transglycosylase [Nocardioidaceae bacterium]